MQNLLLIKQFNTWIRTYFFMLRIGTFKCYRLIKKNGINGIATLMEWECTVHNRYGETVSDFFLSKTKNN